MYACEKWGISLEQYAAEKLKSKRQAKASILPLTDSCEGYTLMARNTTRSTQSRELETREAEDFEYRLIFWIFPNQ